MDRYDPNQIEPKWQRVWADERTWEVSNDFPEERPKAYVLEMLPYPSGEPHIGHLKNYSVGDAIAHFQRRTGMRAPPDGLRRLRPARREPRDQDGPAPARVDRKSIAEFRPAVPPTGGSRSTGRASSAPTSPSTTAGPSGSSCSCTSAASPTARRRRSSGARTTRPCSPTSRSWTAAVSAAARRSSRGSSSSGSSGSPTTPTACSTTSDARLARAHRHDAAELDRPLGGRRGASSGARSSGPTSRSSRRARTRSSARPSSCSRPSTPTCSAWTTAEEVREYVEPRVTESAEERGDEAARRRASAGRRHEPGDRRGVPYGFPTTCCSSTAPAQ